MVGNTAYKLYIIMNGKELLKLLIKNGWTLTRIRGSHHILCKGNEIMSLPVHGSRDLPKGLENRLLKEAGLK